MASQMAQAMSDRLFATCIRQLRAEHAELLAHRAAEKHCYYCPTVYTDRTHEPYCSAQCSIMAEEDR